jgi:hypothetical protein
LKKINIGTGRGLKEPIIHKCLDCNSNDQVTDGIGILLTLASDKPSTHFSRLDQQLQKCKKESLIKIEEIIEEIRNNVPPF